MQDLLVQIAAGSASQQELSEADPNLVFEAKTQSAAPQFRSVARAPKASAKPRTKSYVFSDETVDRMGDVILVGGWDLGNYKQNPVILWGHNAGAPPIGTASRVKTARIDGKRALVGDVSFVEEEVNPHAETIWRLAEAGVLRTVSVGFKPIEASWGDDVTEKERTKYGVGKYGVLYRRSELLETSIVSVPANPGAVEVGLKGLVSKGLISESDAAAWLDEYPTSEEAALERARAAVRSVVDLGKNKAASDDSTDMSDPDEGAPDPDSTTTDGAAASTPDEDPDWVDEPETDETKGAEPLAPLVPALEKLTLAVAGIIEQQAEHAHAMRQLTDVLHDHLRRSADSIATEAPEEPVADDAGDPVEGDPEQVASLLRRAAEAIAKASD